MTDFPAPIDPRHAALLVMDYQAGILGRLDDAAGLLARASDAIELVRRRGGQIGYVRVAFTNGDYAAMPPTSAMATRVAASRHALDADSPTTAIHADVAPAADDIVVRKTRVSAFSTTDLHQQLHDRGITTLLLAGLSTSGVVLSTVRDAADRDYRVLVLRDATADPEPDVHDFLMEKIFPRQGEVITVAELAGVLADPERLPADELGR